jgi:UDP-glucose:(heptosyl)LPS alpha-1,3-glucosyltransferase
MDIAFCHESVLPERGGCETYLVDLARRMLADGHDVHVYACRHDVKVLPRARFHSVPAVAGPRFLRPWRFGMRCLEALEGTRHDVTVGFDKVWGMDVLCPLGGLHSVLGEHNILKNPGPLSQFVARLLKACDLTHQAYLRLERRQYLECPNTRILVNSRLVQRHIADRLGIGLDRVTVIHSAIDPGRFPHAERLRLCHEGRSRWDFAEDDVVGLFVARNYRLKGLAPLLHALQRLLQRPEHRGSQSPLRLLVCGDNAFGPYRRLAEKLGIAAHVRFAGSYPDIATAFFLSDFLVHPSFYDPCSLVVLEAMACDLPVITSRHNGASELMHPPQEGFVIDNPHDHDELAECLGYMLDPARRRACAAAARRTAAQWTFEHHYRKMVQFFQEVAEKRKAA